ncbi:hypothetical protein H4R33_006740 [Dimargaris cristalligena]|nr:hypothetical protein H4R33_006740 [Dimargaris cristalligena]
MRAVGKAPASTAPPTPSSNYNSTAGQEPARSRHEDPATSRPPAAPGSSSLGQRMVASTQGLLSAAAARSSIGLAQGLQAAIPGGKAGPSTGGGEASRHHSDHAAVEAEWKTAVGVTEGKGKGSRGRTLDQTVRLTNPRSLFTPNSPAGLETGTTMSTMLAMDAAPELPSPLPLRGGAVGGCEADHYWHGSPASNNPFSLPETPLSLKSWPSPSPSSPQPPPPWATAPSSNRSRTDPGQSMFESSGGGDIMDFLRNPRSLHTGDYDAVFHTDDLELQRRQHNREVPLSSPSTEPMYSHLSNSSAFRQGVGRGSGQVLEVLTSADMELAVHSFLSRRTDYTDAVYGTGDQHVPASPFTMQGEYDTGRSAVVIDATADTLQQLNLEEAWSGSQSPVTKPMSPKQEALERLAMFQKQLRPRL